MSETTKKPAPRRSRAKPKTAPKARSDAGAPLCAVFTAGPTTIRTGPGRGFEAAGEAAAGDWLLALPAKDGWSEVAAVAGGAFIRGYVPELLKARETGQQDTRLPCGLPGGRHRSQGRARTHLRQRRDAR